jgi:hypothetical protein
MAAGVNYNNVWAAPGYLIDVIKVRASGTSPGTTSWQTWAGTSEPFRQDLVGRPQLGHSWADLARIAGVGRITQAPQPVPLDDIIVFHLQDHCSSGDLDRCLRL